ncbi:U6 small nuclear RNA (adenine-(43)-N(6))-methyltransferase isoform X3 [Drosophila erecta]|nr:U6 small nuclear RNA (adenine-(43)-N(6))-methyltransferase isoform X3 [Drosophila erecta]
MLLKEYYDLDVDFAPGSLVPTLALRLNYILWLEDLMEPLNLQDIRGIDIGCGSSCIYSLLGAKKNGWHMLALESKPQNIEYAIENVKKNRLESLIEVYAQADKTNIFKGYFEQDQRMSVYQFCLCNPPFFDSNLPNPFGGNTRNPERRPAPNNARTGSQEELTCVGGEVQFVQRIIDESLEHKERNLHHDAGRQGQRSKNTRLPKEAAGGECHHHGIPSGTHDTMGGSLELSLGATKAGNIIRCCYH